MDDSVVQISGELEVEAEQSYVDAALEDDQTEVETVERSYATVLSEKEIRELMESYIQNVSDFTLLSKAEATLLLSCNSWDLDHIREQWSADATSLRESIGLFEIDPSSEDKDGEKIFCGVCFLLRPLDKSASVSCGERVCTFCWKKHINKIINKYSPDEWHVWLKCPYALCQASVTPDMIERFGSRKEKSRYDIYLLKSFVDNHKTMKWYIVRGSSCAIDLSPGSGDSSVSCLSLVRFCWNCREMAHSPVDCTTAANWLLENAKTEHKERSRDDLYYSHFDALSIQSDAERYSDCYENWKINELLMETAEANLQKLDKDIEYLSNAQLPTKPQLKCILEAGLQISECRRILKWTYAYEYYLRNDTKQALLKLHREILCKLVNGLNEYLETKLKLFCKEEEEKPSEDFNTFLVTLTEETSKTSKEFEKMVKELENGLANVVSDSASDKTQTVFHHGETSGSDRNHDD